MAENAAAPVRRRARRKEARPGELVAAALDLFTRRGFAATRLDDIAGQAGVSKGTLYLYFESKEDLFRAVVREAVLPNLAEIEAFIDGYKGPSSDLVVLLCRAWWDRVGNTRLSGIPKLILAESDNFPELARFFLAEVAERGQAVMARALKRGIDSGEFRAVDTDYAVRIMIAPLMLHALWQHSLAPHEAHPLDSALLVDTQVDLFLRGIARRDP